jgi:hypothetical protein
MQKRTRAPRYLLACTIAGCSMLASWGSADAQQPTSAQQSAIRASCRGDFQAQCSGVPTGGKEALDCLKQHAASVSPACQQALAPVMGNAAPTAGAAAPAAVAPGASASRTQGAASPAMSPRDEVRVLRSSCQADYRTHCAGVPLGEGRAIACLKQNAAALSPACQHALMAK